MATSLDIRLIPRIKQIIASRGALATFLVPGVSSYDVEQGATVSGATVSYEHRVSPPEKTSRSLVDSVSQRDVDHSGEMSIILPSEDLEFEPSLSMSVRIGTITWKVTQVMPLYTGEQIAAYSITLKR